MNPEYLDRRVTPNSSVSVTHLSNKHFVKLFHYHEQIEIVAIIKSTGTRYVGDSISEFEPGEIVVIGENLPHMWQNSPSFFEAESNEKAEAVSIHLGMDFMTNGLISLPENASIKSLIDQSIRGVLFKENRSAFEKFLTLNELSGYARFLKILEILDELGASHNYESLASDGFMEKISNAHGSRIYLVHQYIMNNFKNDVTLPQLADIANMNPSAFSRYFKKVQGTTLVNYINNIKIGYACKLLLNEDLSVIEVCYQSGFKNVSNFNKQFRKKYGMSPREYRAKL